MAMSVEENKALGRRIIKDFINNNNPAVADELFAADFINHNPALGTSPDLAGLKQMIALYHKAFDDFHLTIEDLIAENDKVMVRMRTTGTHTGELMGIPPTHKRIDSHVISIVRIAGGKVKERWNVTNELEFMRQLGLI
jgi:steroid delta-isomerase-like uncharacterized protein